MQTPMSAIKLTAIAAALAMSLASTAMAQRVYRNHLASGGAGTHSTALRTGSAWNTLKVHRNHNGYFPGPSRYGPR